MSRVAVEWWLVKKTICVSPILSTTMLENELLSCKLAVNYVVKSFELNCGFAIRELTGEKVEGPLRLCLDAE